MRILHVPEYVGHPVAVASRIYQQGFFTCLGRCRLMEAQLLAVAGDVSVAVVEVVGVVVDVVVAGWSCHD